MHYYQFNIGDYAKATRHLNNLEDLAYRRLMDLYYDTEKPLILDIKKLARLINMRENQEEIETVLEDFFFESEGVYVQNRIEKELVSFKLKAVVARDNGKKGGRPRKPNNNPVGLQKEPKPNPSETGSKAKQETLNINQGKKPKAKKIDPPLIEDFLKAITEPTKKLCKENNIMQGKFKELAESCFDHFKGKGEKKADWNATVRNWIRNDKKFNPQDYSEAQSKPKQAFKPKVISEEDRQKQIEINKQNSRRIT